MRPVTMILTAALLAGAAAAQEAGGERVTVPLTDPSRPVTLKATLVNGGITVRAHQGREVIVESQTAGRSQDRHRGRRSSDAPAEKTAGLRRIDVASSGLRVDEEDNRVTVSASPVSVVNLVITVPVSTSVKLNTVNSGGVVVEGVSGEVDANSVNGSVTIRNVSGPVVAHALNKDVTVVLDRLPAEKTMSFSSLNGDIDVTLPSDAKARVKAKVEHGELYTDFDIRLEQPGRPAVEEARSKDKGKYRVRVDRSVTGTINGGGPELQFTTLNGRIYIRKQK